MKKYSIVNNEKNYCLSILKRYIDIYKINEDDILGLISYKDKNQILDGTVYLPDSKLSRLYKYFNVNNYDELYEKLQKRIDVKMKIDNENTLIIDGYILDVKDYKFIHEYYKYLSTEEKIKLANHYNIDTKTLSKKFRKILDGIIDEKIFIDLLKKFNVKKLSELEKNMKNITAENKKKRIVEKISNFKQGSMKENMKQKNFNKSLEHAINKYKKYNINIQVLEQLLGALNDIEYENEMQMILDYNLLIENYIINEIRNENIDYQIIILEENKMLKTMILKNEKYNTIKEDINKIYEDAVENMIQNYDNRIPINKNILIQMKNIIEGNNKLDNENKSEDAIEDKIQMKEEEVMKDLKENKQETNNYNDIIIELSNKYMKETDLSRTAFSEKIQVNRVQLINYLNKKQNSKKVPLAIMEYFDVKTTDELNSKIEKEIEEYKKDSEKNNIDDMLISLSNKYMDETNISRTAFAEKIKVNKTSLLNYLNKKKKSVLTRNLILDYFKVDIIDELESKVELKIKEDSKTNIEEEKSQNITQLKNTNNTISETKIDNDEIIKLVNIDALNSLLKELLYRNKINEREYTIFWLLFGRNNDKYYSKEEIAKFLGVEEYRVTEIYLDCLKIYRNYFDSLLKNIAKSEIQKLSFEYKNGDFNE